MRDHLFRGVLGALLASACSSDSDDLPTEAEIADARTRIEAAVAATEQARDALELLGVIPTYDCGAPRGTFVGDEVGRLRAELACVTVTTAAEATADTITLSFAEGCTVGGHVVAGTAIFRYSGGEARMDLEVDVRALEVDGRTLDALVGYGVCADETRYWVTLATATVELDAQVAKRDGIPVIGSTTLLLDGTGTLTGADGLDSLTCTGVEYEVGDLLPRLGTILLITAGGHSIEATFDMDTPFLREVTVTIDEHMPVTIPLGIGGLP
ncbi:MAG: hypothetical protein EXR73_13020 [Myxococcales bacterium]|nr:hypothetical protein [Myxococcales bacterium]